MNIDDWLTWPTKSTDPGVNFVVLIVLMMVIIFAVVTGALFIIPIAIVLAIAKGIHWYVNQPKPTADMYAQTQSLSERAQFPKSGDFLEAHLGRLFESWEGDYPAYPVYLEMAEVADKLYKAEDLANPLPPLPTAATNSIEEGRYRDKLLTRMRKTANAQRTLDCIHTTIGATFTTFAKHLPPVARGTAETFAKAADGEAPLSTVPLVDVLPNIGSVVHDLFPAFLAPEVEELGLFSDLRKQLELNVHEASGVSFPALANKLILPEKHKGTSREIVHAYLQSTPLENLFAAEIPFSFTDEQRFEHMHVIGGSGHGKTQLLQHLICHDLKREKPPALVIIDSQGEMLRKIQQLELFSRPPLVDRLIIIDPEDVEFPSALNIFDMSNARLAGYSRAHREQIEAGVIELYNYIFGALAAELTQKQGTAFAYVARLMLAVPGATIHTLRQLMEDDAPSIERSPFAEQIAGLDATSQAFFRNQFFSKSFVQTKQQIARRLYGVLQVPAFDRMFSSKTNKLDMFEAMQNGNVVLINTSKALLKSDASALFGRYMIALTMRAAFERVAVTNRNPAFLIVDEASEYFDENLETLLEQARKFNLGVLFAHQHLDQLTPAMRSSVAANTSIKLAGGVSDRDARALAPDMRTDADFITSMQKHSRSTEFACFVRNMTANAVRLQIPFGTLEAAPKISSDAHEKLMVQNRARYAVQSTEPEPQQTVKQAGAVPEEPASTDPDDISTKAAKKW